jgi:hypothetical protein
MNIRTLLLIAAASAMPRIVFPHLEHWLSSLGSKLTGKLFQSSDQCDLLGHAQKMPHKVQGRVYKGAKCTKDYYNLKKE